MAASIIIAVDPGTSDTGVVVLSTGEGRGHRASLNSAHKLIHTAKLHVPPKWKLGDRVFKLLTDLAAETNSYYSYGPSGTFAASVDLVYERPIIMHGVKRFGGPQARDLRSLHELVGALEYWGRSRDFRVVGYEVGAIKEGIAGSATASKEQVELNLRQIWNLREADQGPQSNHEWDALSVAHFHLSQEMIQDREIQGDPRKA